MPQQLRILTHTAAPLAVPAPYAPARPLQQRCPCPNDAAGAGPKSISEAVPPEKTTAVNLHTVRQRTTADVEPECEPEPELGRPPPAKRAPPRPVGRLPSSHRAFGSMRFDGVVPAHAEQLR
eukprot:COSAG01_NODE_24516_length_776_cov_1.100443_1_plen_121_part_01